MIRPNRRDVMFGMMAAGSLCGTAQAEPETTIVETTGGRVRGIREGGVAIFRGIPYAASTGGANRFCPPQPAAPWAGVRDAYQYAPSAPQISVNSPERAAFSAIEPIDEDCLSLNIYTPDGAQSLPVMVWLHGGAWRVGAGSSPGLRGLQLAHDGKVMLVTINHRLDLLGFLKIDDGDDRFADSGNLGILDMVAALQWVRDNASAFGGDPGNVTIFGQSGGGAKVAALLAVPAAKGLFHKAIAMSCSGCLRITEQPEAAQLAEEVAKSLGLPHLTGAALQNVPLQKLIAASRGRHRPILDHRTFTRHPFDPDAPPSASGIPLLIGNVETETRIMLAAASLDNFRLRESEVKERLSRFLHLDAPQTAEIFKAYQSAYPTDAPGDLLAAITSDYSYVRNTRRMADLQARHSAVYTYMFTRRTPALNGLLRSPHEADVPFVFGTASVAANMVGTGHDIAPMTRIMIATWAAFAHTGTPNNRWLPQWPRHAFSQSPCMLLDVHSRVGPVPGANARASLHALPLYEYNMPGNYTHA